MSLPYDSQGFFFAHWLELKMMSITRRNKNSSKMEILMHNNAKMVALMQILNHKLI